MSVFCENCGRRINHAAQCPFCGYIPMEQQPLVQQPPMPVNRQAPPPVPAPPMQNPQQPAVPAPPMQNPRQPAVPVPPMRNPQQPPVPTGTPPTEKPKKAKKKRKLPGIIWFLIIITLIAGVLFGGWYAFGNMVTLYFHSEDVVETLNSGSLELEGTESAYDELPNYVKDMLGEDYAQEDYGPITKAVLPYISVERAEINGFFNESTVIYEITAPDLESWLLGLEDGSFQTEDELMALMTEYMENAPTRTAQVEIKYERDGFFSFQWYGNYYTREFTDAICGGLNSAYNVLYEQAMDEIQEVLEAAKEGNE